MKLKVSPTTYADTKTISPSWGWNKTKKKRVSFHVWIFHLYLLFFIFILFVWYHKTPILHKVSSHPTVFFLIFFFLTPTHFIYCLTGLFGECRLLFVYFHLSFLFKFKRGFSWESILGGIFFIMFPKFVLCNVFKSSEQYVPH